MGSRICWMHWEEWEVERMQAPHLQWTIAWLFRCEEAKRVLQVVPGIANSQGSTVLKRRQPCSNQPRKNLSPQNFCPSDTAWICAMFSQIAAGTKARKMPKVPAYQTRPVNKGIQNLRYTDMLQRELSDTRLRIATAARKIQQGC